MHDPDTQQDMFNSCKYFLFVAAITKSQVKKELKLLHFQENRFTHLIMVITNYLIQVRQKNFYHWSRVLSIYQGWWILELLMIINIYHRWILVCFCLEVSAFIYLGLLVALIYIPHTESPSDLDGGTCQFSSKPAVIL